MNNKFYTGGIFLDIQKAFDRVWHDGLIYKLIQLNFPKYLINILKSFLENRTLKVVIHGETSNTGVIKAGTSQGSVLSPILYSIFTSDFPSHPRTITCLFADDSAVLAQGTTIKYILRTLQSFLVSLEEWLTKWRIAVNTDKTKAIIFRKGCTNYNPVNLELFDEPIKIIVNAPWFIRNSVIHSDLQTESVEDNIQELSRKFFTGIIDHPNNLIADQTDYTEFNGRYRYPYAMTKWSLPLKPP
ncbi:RNA-directed DNA polymerase from mobile element jockey [Araneus ventricosus]|uniref:RNA-directed DNA polymerase from mobile element jockey n=1 Tax=Araneus ventricosus TaxID=182803 RepID=A0A4Y2P1Q0_ARAVE|nr:RNA-directed DNA polymerase from mobile element jockey [Araneus ventricosus]